MTFATRTYSSVNALDVCISRARGDFRDGRATSSVTISKSSCFACPPSRFSPTSGPLAGCAGSSSLEKVCMPTVLGFVWTTGCHGGLEQGRLKVDEGGVVIVLLKLCIAHGVVTDRRERSTNHIVDLPLTKRGIGKDNSPARILFAGARKKPVLRVRKRIETRGRVSIYICAP